MTTNAMILFGLFGLLALACIFFTVRKKGCRSFILALYALVFIFTLWASVYYAKADPGASPDENAHISYIYYVKATGEIIPHFEEMGLFTDYTVFDSDSIYMYRDDMVNYLCHPPLYYQIMRLAGGFINTQDAGFVGIDKMHLRYFSLGIFALGLALIFYIGYSCLDKNKPWIHFFYAIAASSIPMLTFEGCAVTNDNLALVTGALATLGLLRYCKGRRDYLTYILIASGITASLLTKMTAAMLVIFMAGIILLYTIFKEKSIAKALTKEFWITCPIYFIALAYFAIIYSRYGVIQVSLQMICSQEYFESTIYYTPVSQRQAMTLGQYIAYYLQEFFLSWSGIEASNRYTKLTCFNKASLPLELLWLFPGFALVPGLFKKVKSLSLPIIAGWISCLVTFFIQLKSAYGTFLTRGYRGGFQSRYYLPLLFVFALGTAYLLQSLDNKKSTAPVRYLSCALALIYAFLLFYANVPFFMIHFA